MHAKSRNCSWKIHRRRKRKKDYVIKTEKWQGDGRQMWHWLNHTQSCSREHCFSSEELRQALRSPSDEWPRCSRTWSLQKFHLMCWRMTDDRQLGHIPASVFSEQDSARSPGVLAWKFRDVCLADVAGVWSWASPPETAEHPAWQVGSVNEQCRGSLDSPSTRIQDRAQIATPFCLPRGLIPFPGVSSDVAKKMCWDKSRHWLVSSGDGGQGKKGSWQCLGERTLACSHEPQDVLRQVRPTW